MIVAPEMTLMAAALVGLALTTVAIFRDLGPRRRGAPRRSGPNPVFIDTARG